MKIKLEVLNDKYLFKLINTFKKEIFVENEKKIVEVPYGFKTDLASIPKLFWSWLSPFGKHQEAALIHDYLYKNDGKLKGLKNKLTRKESDLLFKNVMLADGVSNFNAQVMYLAVRTFGWNFWNKTKEEQKDDPKELNYEK